MISRRDSIAFLGGSAFTGTVLSQQPAKIGYLYSGFSSDLTGIARSVLDGLREYGYVEGDNLIVEKRFTEGRSDRLPELAEELVRLKPDAIVSIASPAALALKKATTSIPLVTVVVGDAVAAGLVSDLARPGGNITGNTFFLTELMAKRLELLKGTLPKSSRFAALMLKNQAMNGAMVEAMQSVAKSLRIELHDFYYEKSDDIPQIFAAFVKQKIRGLIVQENPVIGAYLKEVVQLTLKHRIPSIGFGSYADVGAPLAYGVDLKVFARRAGYFVNRILKGEKPGDIPFERATRFEMIINQKAVKTLGMTISPAINVQATRIID